MAALDGRVALVTGASRGVGRGVATSLAASGATVYATGRSVAAADLPATVRRVTCDHANDDAVAAVFQQIRADAGQLDILVNCAWGGYERMVEEGRFTWPAPFWDQPSWRWEAMLGIGVRGAFVASQHAARLMVAAGRGLIVNLSYWAARKHMGNVIYGVAKAATDKLTADTAQELKEHGVAVVSLYPGLVRTEAVLAAGVFDLANSESPEFLGRVVGALAADPLTLERSGQVLVAAGVAREYQLQDTDGRVPRPLTLEEA
jgi:dehydrogenase/reductase SDR family member 1